MLWNVATEAEMVGISFTNFSKFTVKSKQLCGVNTCFGKFTNSGQKTLVFEVAFLFLLCQKKVSKFISEGISFSITLLSTGHLFCL